MALFDKAFAVLLLSALLMESPSLGQAPVGPPVNSPVDPPVADPVPPPVNPPVAAPAPVTPPQNPTPTIPPPVNPPVDPPVADPVPPPVNPPVAAPAPVAAPQNPTPPTIPPPVSNSTGFYLNNATGYSFVPCPAGLVPTSDFSGCETPAEGAIPNQPCYFNTECTDSGYGRGLCTNGLCACASGYGNVFSPISDVSVCDGIPSFTCVPTPVDPLTITLPTSILAFTYNYGRVSIAVRTPYEDPLGANSALGTRLHFGSKTTSNGLSQCDYPYGNFSAFQAKEATDYGNASGSCYADFVATNWDWPTLRSCGWEHAAGVDDVYTVRLWIERDYLVTQGRVTVQRTVRAFHDLSIQFPRHLTAVQNGTVSLEFYDANVENNLAISSVAFEDDSNWVVQMVSSTLYPFQFATEPSIPVWRHQSLFNSSVVAGNLSISNLGCNTTGYGQECLQFFTIELAPGCGALNLASDYLFVEAGEIELSCVPSANCSNITLDTVPELKLQNLVTNAACPTNTIDIPNPTSLLFSTDSSYMIPKYTYNTGEEVHLFLGVTPSSVVNGRDSISDVQVLSVTVPSIGDITNTPSVTLSGGYVLQPNTGAYCTQSNVACFSIHTSQAPFALNTELESFTFQVGYEIAYNQGAKKRAVQTVTLRGLAESNAVAVVPTAQTPVYSNAISTFNAIQFVGILASVLICLFL